METSMETQTPAQCELVYEGALYHKSTKIYVQVIKVDTFTTRVTI